MTQVYAFGNEDLEANAEGVKVAILEAMVKEEIISKSVAEKWARDHAIIVKTKHKFKNVFARMLRKDSSCKHKDYYCVVTRDLRPEKRLKSIPGGK